MRRLLLPLDAGEAKGRLLPCFPAVSTAALPLTLPPSLPPSFSSLALSAQSYWLLSDTFNATLLARSFVSTGDEEGESTLVVVTYDTDHTTDKIDDLIDFLDKRIKVGRAPRSREYCIPC